MKERLVGILNRYFEIGDSYTYNLMRSKEAFEIGTMTFDDFIEFNEEVTSDLADFLLSNGVTL